MALIGALLLMGMPLLGLLIGCLGKNKRYLWIGLGTLFGPLGADFTSMIRHSSRSQISRSWLRSDRRTNDWRVARSIAIHLYVRFGSSIISTLRMTHTHSLNAANELNALAMRRSR